MCYWTGLKNGHKLKLYGEQTSYLLQLYITLTLGQQMLPLTKHLFAAPGASDESLELRAALSLLG